MIDACEKFVSGHKICSLGHAPYPWEKCAREGCGQPKAQHEMPHCRSQAIVRGEIFECQRRVPHKGVRCKSGDAEWGTE